MGVWEEFEEMNKPEKKTGTMLGVGYNQAYDDWEAYLPNEEEINQVIRNHFSTIFQKPDLMIAIVEAGNNAAKAIAKRIGK